MSALSHAMFGSLIADQTAPKAAARTIGEKRIESPKAVFSPRVASWAPVPAGGQQVAVEQYRRLAAQLLQAQAERGVKSVMVTSSAVAEGKSVTVANLALTLARSYQRRTLVIDADERSPMQHQIFNVDNSRGLGDWLRADDSAPATTLEVHPMLTLLTAGHPTGDPMAGLTSDRLKALMAEATETFDFVLVDAPPAPLVPDAGLLAALVDATVLVVRAGITPHAAIERAIAAVGRDRILGVVLNEADVTAVHGYPYGYGRK